MSFLIIMAICIVWSVGKWLYPMRPLRKREPGFGYVYVERDGSVRELDTDEREYLSTEFDPCDGARPYIKSYYKEKIAAN